MQAGLTFEVGITTRGGDNSRTCRMADNERAQREKKAVGLVCASYRPADGCNLGQLLRAMAAKGPLDVRVVRLYTGTKPCDPHNLPSRLKAFIDGLAKVFEVDDGNPHIRYITDQERAKRAGVRVEVGPRAKVLPWPPWTAFEWRRVFAALESSACMYKSSGMPADEATSRRLAADAEAMAAALEKP